FFFFQAEDGIRDLYVTGVQTCALPIWYFFPRNKSASRMYGYFTPDRKRILSASFQSHADVMVGILLPRTVLINKDRLVDVINDRSEERRVGKECRCLRLGYH